MHSGANRGLVDAGLADSVLAIAERSPTSLLGDFQSTVASLRLVSPRAMVSSYDTYLFTKMVAFSYFFLKKCDDLF